jgi:hypothetical protein
VPVRHHPRTKGRSKYNVVLGRFSSGIAACVKLRRIMRDRH